MYVKSILFSILQNKKGSTTVFMTCVILSMVLVSGFFLEAASGLAARSIGEGTLDLASESLLTEYHKNLKNHYGLLAFHGEKETMEEKLMLYGNATFQNNYPKKSKDKNLNLIRLNMEKATIDLTGFSLTQPDLFEEEIVRYMKYKGASIAADLILGNSFNKEIADSKSLQRDKQSETEQLEKSLRNSEKEEGKSEEGAGAGDANNRNNDEGKGVGGNKDEEKAGDGGKAEDERIAKEGKKKLELLKEYTDQLLNGSIESDSNQNEDVVLRNEKIIYFLPSQRMDSVGNAPMTGNQGNNLIVGQYILSTFKNGITEQGTRSSFFQNEVEYILAGGFEDYKNFQTVKREIALMRTALNMSYIYSNPTMLRQATTAASALTPGPWVPLTQLVLVGIWSGVEAYNDLDLLLSGKKVPFLKTESSWATDIDSILKGVYKGDSQEGGKSGLDYKGYLAILLATNGRSNNLLRTMDLIQLNMKGLDDETFLLEEYFVGFQYKAELKKISGFFGIMGSGFRDGEIEGVVRY